jgi:hypothetical protein
VIEVVTIDTPSLGDRTYLATDGAAYHVNAADAVAFDRAGIADGDAITAGPSMRVRVIATPGHTFTHLTHSGLRAWSRRQPAGARSPFKGHPIRRVGAGSPCADVVTAEEPGRLDTCLGVSDDDERDFIHCWVGDKSSAGGEKL